MWKATRLQKGILICLIVICSTFLIFLSINTVQAAAQEKTIIKSITGWACEGYVLSRPYLAFSLDWQRIGNVQTIAKPSHQEFGLAWELHNADV
jgi:arginine exporter protein ArgO